MKTNWEKFNLRENIGVMSGFPFSSQYFSDENGFPLIRIRDLTKGKTELKFAGEYQNQFIVNQDDILIGMDGDYHIVKWSGEKALLNQRILKIFETRDSKLHLDFVYYWLQPFLLEVNDKTAATTVKHLSTSDVTKAKINAPHYEQQQKIAKILTTVDNLIEQTQALIDKYTAIKQGMMANLFTRGIDLSGTPETNPNHGQLRPSFEEAPEFYKETELGWVPREWEVKKFKNITDILTCGVAATPVYVEEGEGYVFLSARNVKNGRLDLSKVSYIPEWLHIQLTKHNKPRVGDILYSRVGAGFGEAAVVEIDLDFSVYVSLTHIRMKRGHDAYFYKFLMNTHQVKNKASIDVFQGGGVPNLNVTEVREFYLPVPSENEQLFIAHKLKVVENFISLQEAESDKYKTQKKGLMQDLLTGKIHVTV